MSATVSTEFTEHLIVLNPREPSLALLKVEHALGGTLRFVNDNLPLTHRGEVYVESTFEAVRPSDSERQIPRAQIRVANIGNRLAEFLQRTRGARGARVSISIVRRSKPDQVEGGTLEFFISAVTLVNLSANIDLSYESAANRGAVNMIYRPETAPGLFGT